MAAIAGRQGFRNPDEIGFDDDFAMDSGGDYAMDENGNLFMDVPGECVNPNDFDGFIYNQPGVQFDEEPTLCLMHMVTLKFLISHQMITFQRSQMRE